MRRGEILLQEPIDPTGTAAAGIGADRFERDDPLAVAADSGVVLIERVAAEHPEDRNRNLFALALRRKIGVALRRVVGVRPVAAPERVAVGSVLVFAVAGGGDAVSAVEIVEQMRVEEPAPHRIGFTAEEFDEFLHEDVGELFAFLRRVADGEADIGVPVPRPAAAPFDSGGLGHLLNHLEPDAGFVLFRHLPLEEFDERPLDQRVVLKQPGGGQRVLFRQRHLLPHRFKEIDRSPRPRFDGADEVDDVDEIAVFHEASLQMICDFVILYRNNGGNEMSEMSILLS